MALRPLSARGRVATTVPVTQPNLRRPVPLTQIDPVAETQLVGLANAFVDQLLANQQNPESPVEHIDLGNFDVTSGKGWKRKNYSGKATNRSFVRNWFPFSAPIHHKDPDKSDANKNKLDIAVMAMARNDQAGYVPGPVEQGGSGSPSLLQIINQLGGIDPATDVNAYFAEIDADFAPKLKTTSGRTRAETAKANALEFHGSVPDVGRLASRPGVLFTIEPGSNELIPVQPWNAVGARHRSPPPAQTLRTAASPGTRLNLSAAVPLQQPPTQLTGQLSPTIHNRAIPVPVSNAAPVPSAPISPRGVAQQFYAQTGRYGATPGGTQGFYPTVVSPGGTTITTPYGPTTYQLSPTSGTARFGEAAITPGQGRMYEAGQLLTPERIQLQPRPTGQAGLATQQPLGF